MNPVISTEQYEKLKSSYPDMPHYVVDDMHVKVPAGWLIDRCGWKGKVSAVRRFMRSSAWY